MRAWYRTGRGVGLVSLVVLVLLIVGFTPHVESDRLSVFSDNDPVERVIPAIDREAPQDDADARAAERAMVERRLLEAKAEAAKEAAAAREVLEESVTGQFVQDAVAQQGPAPTSATAPATASASASATRGAVPSDTTMYLTIPKLGLFDIPVYEGTSEASLSAGTGHLSGTGYPWLPGSNTYIAGHRLGYPGTVSDHVFWDLPSLAIGDQVVIEDSLGQTYTYTVSEVLEVPITDLSVTAPVGRDVVSLQTCIENYGDYWSPGPNWFVRYVVRADLVA
jgi:LPXTG-site transpeptidase (sortase) family protein